jgi:hypothetical protein
LSYIKGSGEAMMQSVCGTPMYMGKTAGLIFLFSPPDIHLFFFKSKVTLGLPNA